MFPRSVAFIAALSLVIAACGDDGDNGGGPDNQAPTAAFTSSCNALACTFTDASSDPDGANDIEAWDWDFGGDGESQEQSPAHTFSAAGNYDVELFVTDAAGETSSVTHQVSVQAPTAAFTVECASLECTFTDASTDSDGADYITSWEWDFGDPTSPDNASSEQSPTHTYSFTELTEVTVTLTVTDAAGDEATTTQTFDVSPAAGLTCDGVDCSLTLPEDASITVELVSADCEASRNTFVVLTPVLDTLFTDGCNTPEPGTPDAIFQLDNGAVFAAGTEITAQVISGLLDQDNPPTLRVTGGFPTYFLEFDDGRGILGEPDFNELILTVTAEPGP